MKEINLPVPRLALTRSNFTRSTWQPLVAPILRVGFRFISAGLLLLLEGCIDIQGQTPTPADATPGAETSQPAQSPPVTPGQSQELQDLPTSPPYNTGTPVYEINPRVRPQLPLTPTPPNAPTSTETPE